jgi:hypothetical protein
VNSTASTAYAAAKPGPATSRAAIRVPGDGLQHVGRRQQLRFHQSRDDRGPGRVVDGEPGGLQGHQAVEQADRLHPPERLGDEGEHDHPQPESREQGDAAPVVRVDERSAVQTEQDQRHQREDAEQPDREGGPGDVVDLQTDRDDAELGAEVGQAEAGPQTPEGGDRPQRGQIQQESQIRLPRRAGW